MKLFKGFGYFGEKKKKKKLKQNLNYSFNILQITRRTKQNKTNNQKKKKKKPKTNLSSYCVYSALAPFRRQSNNRESVSLCSSGLRLQSKPATTIASTAVHISCTLPLSLSLTLALFIVYCLQTFYYYL